MPDPACASTALYRPLPSFLEHPPQARLHLPRVAEPGPDGPVEVEEQRRGRGVPEVVGVGEVKDLDDRLDFTLVADRDRPRDAHVPREEGVVLAQRVALQDGAVGADAVLRGRGALTAGEVVDALLGDRLGRVDAEPVVDREAAHAREHPAVEAVALVAIAPVVLRAQDAGARVPERERAALVVVVRLVVRQGVVELELEVPVQHALQPQRDAPVPRARRALQRRERTQTARPIGPRLPEGQWAERSGYAHDAGELG